MKKIIPLLAAFVFLISCGSRIPSPEKAQKSISKHLNRYGDEYPNSFLGNTKTQNVEILEREEIQKGLAAILARITLQNGQTFDAKFHFIHKSPFGWRPQSWEKIGD